MSQFAMFAALLGLRRGRPRDFAALERVASARAGAGDRPAPGRRGAVSPDRRAGRYRREGREGRECAQRPRRRRCRCRWRKPSRSSNSASPPNPTTWKAGPAGPLLHGHGEIPARARRLRQGRETEPGRHRPARSNTPSRWCARLPITASRRKRSRCSRRRWRKIPRTSVRCSSWARSECMTTSPPRLSPSGRSCCPSSSRR